jgi:hypothetical protein
MCRSAAAAFAGNCNPDSSANQEPQMVLAAMTAACMNEIVKCAHQGPTSFDAGPPDGRPHDLEGDQVRTPLPIDPFSLTRIGLGTWMTNLLVAQKFAEALMEQNALITGAMHSRPTG